jgi:hypothetical protein
MLATSMVSKKVLRYCLPMLLIWSANIMANPLIDFKKVGEAKLAILFWDVYQSELYSLTGAYQKNIFPQALKIHYLRNIKAKDLIERTEEEWQKLGINSQISAPWIEQLKTMWPNIKKGDELLVVVNKSGDSDFYFNQQEIGTIINTDFGANFLRIWLDEKSSYPELQKQLTGEKK